MRLELPTENTSVLSSYFSASHLLNRPSDLVEPFLGEAAPGWRRRQATARCFAIPDVHLPPNLAHHVDHLVYRNGEGNSRHRHFDPRQGYCRSGRVAENAGQLDKSALESDTRLR